MTMRLTAALMLALLAGTATAGEIYTWKDKEGRVNYADSPAPDATSVRTLRGREGEGSATPADSPAVEKPAAKSVAEQELEFRKRLAEAAENKAKADKDAAAAADKRSNCERARNLLKGLESGHRVARFNAKGEREFLDDAQRAEEIANARKAVASWCG
jgi:hypothetical protein